MCGMSLVVQLLQANSLFVKQSKRSSACRRVKYLGHYIDELGVYTNPKMMEAVIE